MTTAYSTSIVGCIERTAITAVDGVILSYILIRETFSDEIGEDRSSYSFFVAVCGAECGAESAFVRDVTESAECALEFFTLISERAVTPCTLYDVAEDFVASR